MELIQGTFTDLDAMCEAFRAWDVEFYPLGQVSNGVVVGSFVQAIGHSIQYGYSGYTPGLSMSGTPPKGLITFNLMAPANRRYWVRGHDLDDTMAWVFPVGAELRSVSAPGFKVHTLSVSEEYIERITAALEINLPPLSKRPEAFPIRTEFLPRVRLLLRELREDSEMFGMELADEVLRLLVASWGSPRSDGTMGLISLRAREIAVRKCLELIESYDLGKITNEILLKECHTSERTLQYAFRERFGVTPYKFITSRRLAKVRMALRQADPGKDTVGNIAADCGFWHLGRFAAEYRRTFGELPSETLRKSYGAK